MQIDLNISTSIPTLLTLSFFIMLFAFTVYSWMLAYHWFAYGTSTHISRTALVIYLAGSSLLFLAMGGALYLITTGYVG